jgi:pyroglutamyl-peptidase
VRGLVPSFYDTLRPFDVVIHIGMAGPRPFYSIERRGHRDGYKHPDVDGEIIDSDEDRQKDEWPWRGLPEEIETELHLDQLLSLWQGHSSVSEEQLWSFGLLLTILPKEYDDLRISEDAGHYLCDFIYYSSLSELWKHQRPRKTVFLHVPADASPSSVERGRDLTLNLIRSIVESEMIAKNKPLESKVGDGEL